MFIMTKYYVNNIMSTNETCYNTLIQDAVVEQDVVLKIILRTTSSVLFFVNAYDYREGILDKQRYIFYFFVQFYNTKFRLSVWYAYIFSVSGVSLPQL